MLAWTVGILAAVFLGVGTLLYQRVTSVETSLNRSVDDLKDDLKEDISENKAMIQRVLEQLDKLKK